MNKNKCQVKRLQPSAWVYSDLKWWTQFPGFRFWKKYTGGIGFFQALWTVCQHSYARLRYGASWYDWINFDQYLAAVVANAAHDLRDHSIGYPASMTLQEWQAILMRIEGPLRNWTDHDHRDKLTHIQEKALYEECEKALHLLADNFGSFWD